jgi:hypothetical protein
MFQKTVLIECAGAANTIYLPVPYPCTLLKARWTANADPGANHTVVLSKAGGNTIISGDVSATPGQVVTGTLTATVADQRQAMDEASPLKLVITLSNPAKVGLVLDLDPFKQNPEA